MEAPLRWLAEGYQLIHYGFPSVPGLLYRFESALPNQPLTPALPVVSCPVSASPKQANGVVFRDIGCIISIFCHGEALKIKVVEILSMPS
ncbi:hypothetical protein K449DRAFT_430844 [Hypoxylon sp. EC38]|nr:hypothetical protein K449DRAFT_430844 [Hypoxylon sp. EC38]